MVRRITAAAVAVLVLILAGCSISNLPLRDDFQSYTPNAALPAPWIVDSCDGDAPVVKADPAGSLAAYKQDLGNCRYFHSGTSAENYAVKADVRWGGTLPAIYGIYARRTAANTYYDLRIYMSFKILTLARIVDGTPIGLGTPYLLPESFNYSIYHTLKLAVNGSDIRAYLDGEEKFAVVNSDITGPGYAGFSILVSDAYIDNFEQELL